MIWGHEEVKAGMELAPMAKIRTEGCATAVAKSCERLSLALGGGEIHPCLHGTAAKGRPHRRRR
jgi:hypothetical protein